MFDNKGLCIAESFTSRFEGELFGARAEVFGLFAFAIHVR